MIGDMKQNWTYKKLTDICDIQYGYPFDSACFSTTPEDGMPLIRIRDVMVGCSNTFYKGDYPKEYTIHKGDYLIGMDGEFNIAPWKSGDALLNQRVCKISSKSNEVSIGYLYRFLTKELKKIEDETPFVTVKHLSAKRLNQVLLPVPSIETQSRIVAELDLLQSIIDKQKAQLKEYDNLAQCIFYDMFGDPVDNDKGWEVKKLGEMCEVYRGGSPRPIEQYLGGTIPWIKIGDATKGDDIYLHQTKEHIIEEGLKKTRFIHSGSLIFANCGVSLGFARIITFDGCIHDGWLAFDNISSGIEKVFLLKSLNFCTSYFRSIAPDGTQPNLNTAIMKAFKQILPPLSMQKQYIAKIESIEKQKAAISKSIAETEKLFEYTMDKYFG